MNIHHSRNSDRHSKKWRDDHPLCVIFFLKNPPNTLNLFLNMIKPAYQPPPRKLSFLSWRCRGSRQFFLSKTLAHNPSLLKPLFSSLKCSLRISSSLSRCRALRDAKNPPHTFSRHPNRVSPPNISKTFFTLSLKCILYQLAPLSISTTSFFFPFNLGIPHHQPRNSSLFNSSFNHKVFLAAPHKSIIAYPLRIHMKSTQKSVEPVEKNFQILTKYSLKSKESKNKK